MKHKWIHDHKNRRQHWLYYGTSIRGLVYEVKPDAFSVYGEGFQRNSYAREFLGIMPTLDEAKDMLLTITASQQL